MDAHDIIPLMCRIKEVCKPEGIAIFDTNISPYAKESLIIDKDLTLHGCYWKEHEKGISDKERIAAGWSSYRNNNAFWLTERSLINALKYSALHLYQNHYTHIMNGPT